MTTIPLPAALKAAIPTARDTVAAVGPDRGQPHLIVIGGPSGVGKGTVIRSLRQRYRNVREVRSVTTRPPRPSDDTDDYTYVDAATFDRWERQQLFAESATYGRHRYASPAPALLGPDTDTDTVVIYEVDLAGMMQLRRHPAIGETASYAYLVPPTIAAHRQRLARRNQADQLDAATIAERLATAQRELDAVTRLPYVRVHINQTGQAEQLGDRILGEALGTIAWVSVAEQARSTEHARRLGHDQPALHHAGPALAL